VVIQERITEQVAYLATLSDIETLRLLDNMEYYRWPGAFIGAGTIFIVGPDGNLVSESLYEENSIELRRILSNRVFRKALEDMRGLPKDQASQLIGSELDDALSKYLTLYNGFIESQSLDIGIVTRRDGQPTIHGLRKKVFSLILIAGSLELTDIHGRIQRIDAIAKGQEPEIRRIEDEHTRRQFSGGISLHNNLVLASGLYGTLPPNLKEDARLKPFTDHLLSIEIVDFSAPATEYDMLVRHGIRFATPDRGLIGVRYFPRVTDGDLNELRSILGLPYAPQPRAMGTSGLPHPRAIGSP